MVINNAALSKSQKTAAYKAKCDYNMPDTNAYSSRTCSDCGYGSGDSACMPCSDAVPICTKINTWKRDSSGVVPTDLDNPFNGYNVNWKVIAMGVGEGLSSTL